MLIFSKAPCVFFQPTSFKEVALLNQAIMFVAEPWNITASFNVMAVKWKADLNVWKTKEKEIA